MGIVNVGMFGIYAFAWCLCCKETLGKIVTIICNQVYTERLRVPYVTNCRQMGRRKGPMAGTGTAVSDTQIPVRIDSMLGYPTSSVVEPHHVDADPGADPDSTYQPDADPDSDFYLMLIRIRIFTLMRIRIQILASKKGSSP
jgi:hypothetical protein